MLFLQEQVQLPPLAGGAGGGVALAQQAGAVMAMDQTALTGEDGGRGGVNTVIPGIECCCSATLSSCIANQFCCMCR